MPSNKTILIAPNAFKGTLTAAEAAEAIARGVRKAMGRRVRLVKMPVADGGDGFAEVLVAALRGRWVRRGVHDALGAPLVAPLGLSRDGKTAVIEMARASGLAILQRRRGEPGTWDATGTSTRGTGELLRAALESGATRILLGIGGSATTDGGTGLARALGVRFLDRRGRDIAEGGVALRQLERIDLGGLDKRLLAPRGKSAPVSIEVACDVTNPLHGKNGAAYIFSPQKGATPSQVRVLDAGLRQLAEVIQRDLGVDVQSLPGAGAAGGTGAGLVAFFGARLRPGFDLVAETIGLRQALRTADLVITGEGRIDGQTAQGKAPGGVLQLAREAGVPAAAIGGSLGPGAVDLGFQRLASASQGYVPKTRREAMALLAAAAVAVTEEDSVDD